MELKTVKSSNIEAIGHDPETNTLTVRFKGGNVYHYEGVDADKHKALMGASSVGSHFHANIKNLHKFSVGGKT